MKKEVRITLYIVSIVCVILLGAAMIYAAHHGGSIRQKDSRQIAEDLLLKVGDLLLIRDVLVERDCPQPSKHRVVAAVEAGAMVADKEVCVTRGEVVMLLIQVPC